MARKARFAILITGVPGTGKTTAAALAAAKSGAAILEINKLAQLLGLYSHTDEKDGAKVVLLGKLESEASQAIEAESNPLIVEGHLGCEMRLPVSKVIVLRCEPGILRARLASRRYPPAKLASNALSEALDYCTVLSEKNYGKRKVWEIDTTAMAPEEVAFECGRIISGKRKKKGKAISFQDALLREAVSGERIRNAIGR
jgi:adenylate kinase